MELMTIGKILFILSMIGTVITFFLPIFLMGESSADNEDTYAYVWAVGILLCIVGWISLFIFGMITGIGFEIPIK